MQGELQTDSRKVKAGDAFVAWPGAATDGRAYVGQALAQAPLPCWWRPMACRPLI